MTETQPFPVELVKISDLKPHPRNYSQHPKEQIEEIVASIRANQFYRNIVIARDNTILAGHGVVLAVTEMGWEYVPAVRMDLDPDSPQALKILVGDNEIRHLAERDDRALTDMLLKLKNESELGLAGTGFNAMLLAERIYITRPENEIRDINAAAELAGVPGYVPEDPEIKMIFSFATLADKEDLLRRLGVKHASSVQSFWWNGE